MQRQVGRKVGVDVLEYPSQTSHVERPAMTGTTGDQAVRVREVDG